MDINEIGYGIEAEWNKQRDRFNELWFGEKLEEGVDNEGERSN